MPSILPLTYWNDFLLLITAFIAGGLNVARKIPPQIIRWFVSIVAVSVTTYFFVRG